MLARKAAAASGHDSTACSVKHSLLEPTIGAPALILSHCHPSAHSSIFSWRHLAVAKVSTQVCRPSCPGQAWVRATHIGPCILQCPTEQHHHICCMSRNASPLLLVPPHPDATRPSQHPAAWHGAQVKLFGGYARWACDLPTPHDGTPARMVLTTADTAVRWATNEGLEGPVHLNCPFREPLLPGAAPWNPTALQVSLAWIATLHAGAHGSRACTVVHGGVQT